MSPKANGSFATEPHEAGWADEALAIIYVSEVSGPAPRMVLRPQISADGIRWLDHGALRLLIEKPGGYQLELARFGNWLRVAGEVSGGPPGDASAFLLDFYWVLKG